MTNWSNACRHHEAQIIALQQQAQRRQALNELYAEEARITRRFQALGTPTRKQRAAQRKTLASIRAWIDALTSEPQVLLDRSTSRLEQLYETPAFRIAYRKLRHRR